MPFPNLQDLALKRSHRVVEHAPGPAFALTSWHVAVERDAVPLPVGPHAELALHLPTAVVEDQGLLRRDWNKEKEKAIVDQWHETIH